MPNVFDQFDAKPATKAGSNVFDQFDSPAVDDPALYAAAKAAPSAPSVTYDAAGTPDYSAVLNSSEGGLGQSLMRGIFGRGPDIVANLIEMPATANEAVIRATGATPSDTGVFAGMRGLLRKGAGAVRDIGYSRDMDAVGYGAPRVSGSDALDAVNPASDMRLGDRFSTVGTFVPEALAGSVMDMAATLNPLTLGGYVASRTNEVAKNRAANDKREDVTLGDIGVAAPAAAVEALLERFTTMRLLPQGTTMATPGARAAVVKIAKELGLQGALGGVEEVVPYLAETAGTETGATPRGAAEAFAGGALAEGVLGGGVQGAKTLGARFSPADIASAEIETALDDETFANRPDAPLGARMAPVSEVPAAERPVIVPEAPAPDADAPFRRPEVPTPVVPEVVAAEAPVAEGWTDRGGKQSRANVSDSSVDGTKGAISLESRSGADDNAPLEMWVAADGSLKTRGQAFTKEGEQTGLWRNGTDEQKAAVVDLLRRRNESPVGSPERKAIDQQVKDIVNGTTPEPAQTTPQQPTAERLYSDYNPEVSQTETRVDGNLSFPESRLTRRALDDALSDPDPVNAAERLLTNIAEQPDIRPEQKWLAETLAPLMKPLGVKLIEPNPSQPYAGAYSNTDNTVYIRQADPETALHETAHGVTSALATDPAARADPVVARAQDELAAMHSHLQTGIGMGEIDTSNVHPEIRRLLDDKQGPLSNVKELIAYGLSNRPFQDFLKSLPPPPGREQARNMWEYFKSVVTSMFGAKTDAQRSYLDALIESSADLIDFAGKNPQATKVVKEVAASRLTPAEKLEPTPPAKPPAPKPEPAVAPKPERPPTSTKNAFVDADRERAGKEPIARATPRSNETTLEMGKAAIADNPDLPAELIARLSVSGVSSINSVEEAALQVESERLRAERDRQADRAADPELSESARAIARQKFDEAEAAIDQIDAATRNSGTEWGRFGQYRQRALRDDYTLAALERKARAVKGEPLTAEETGKLREMADTIAKQQKRLESTQKRLDEYESGAAVAQTYKRLLEDMRKPRGPVDVAALRERAERAKAALRELAGTDAAVMTDAATLTPQQALIDLGAYHYADGGKTLADWTKRMEADVPAQYREGLADLFELSKAGAARPVIEPGKLTHKNVYDLALAEVRNGVKGEDAVMKAVFESVRVDNPDLTERDVRRLFTEYGKKRFPTRDADRARVSELKSLVKMEESIKRMEEGLAPMKGAPRAARSEEIKQRHAEYSAARKAFERKFPDPDADARYQRGRATSLARQLAEVQERLRTGDYEKSVRIPKELNEANTKAAYELQQAKEVFLRQQFEWEMSKRSPLRKVFGGIGEAFNLARAMQTGFDLSGLLRQGGFITYGHPVRALKAARKMLDAARSEEGAFRIKEEIEKRPNARLYKSSGLELTEIGSGLSLSKLEEAFMSRWLEKVPTPVGSALRGSQRAFTTVLNVLRADTFDAMVASLARNGENPTQVEAKAIANYVNVATGRGKIGFGDKTTAATGLNTVFFAPRLVASRVNLLGGQPLYGGTTRTRKLVLAEYARFLMGVSAIMALGSLAHDDDDDEKPFIGTDPRSSDFLKMRFGKTYIDPMTGLSQVTVFLARELTGETVTGSGNVNKLRKTKTLTNLLAWAGGQAESLGWHEVAARLPTKGDYDKLGFGESDAFDTATRFARTKFAPIPGAIVNAFTETDVVGDEVGVTQSFGSLVVPLSMQNVSDVVSEHGVDGGTAITLVELLGMGVQYRDPAQMKAADYKEMSREEKNTYSAYVQEAQKIKKAKTDLQDFANSLPEDMSIADTRYEVEKKAAELGLEGATVDAYKRDTTARDDRGHKRRGVKRSETGSVKLNWKQAYSLSGYSAADKTVSAIDSDIEALDEDDITNAELEKIHGKYVFSSLTDGGDTQASDDDIEAVRKTLRWQRKWSQDNFVKERAK